MFLLKHPELCFFFKKYLMTIAKLYICIVLVNIKKNVYVKYAHILRTYLLNVMFKTNG